MNHLKTFESAAQHIGIDPNILPEVGLLPEYSRKSIVAFYKLSIISKAAWDSVVIDWNNWDQYKYYPWFDLSSDVSVGSSSGFSYYDYLFGTSGSDVGSRLVFPTREIAEYIGKEHIDLYRDLMVIE